MPIEEAEYCQRMCGAKCCYLHREQERIPCPKLAADNSCSIYEERFHEEAPDILRVGHYEYKGKQRPFFCARILLVAHDLPFFTSSGRSWATNKIRAQKNGLSLPLYSYCPTRVMSGASS